MAEAGEKARFIQNFAMLLHGIFKTCEASGYNRALFGLIQSGE